MAAGSRLLPIYAADGSSLYMKVDDKDVYKEGDVSRDEFTGDYKLETTSYTDSELRKESYWDANRGDWDNSSLTQVISWKMISIISGDSSDADYVGAFEGCGNFTGIDKKAGAPTLDGNHTINFFKDCIQFNSSLQEWDFSNILRSDGMFDGCVSLSDAAFHNTLLKMNMDKNEAITVDDPQYIGAEGVKVTSKQTADLIEKMRLEGQIVTDYVEDLPITDFITYNSGEIFNTTFYTFDGKKSMV